VTQQNDIPDWLGPGTALQSVSDPLKFLNVIGHRRYLLTETDENKFQEGQYGRILIADRCNTAVVRFTTISGTVATDTTTYLNPAASIKMTSPAVAGNVAQMRQFTQLAADQGTSTFPEVVAEIMFQPRDANIRGIQLFARLDDTVKKYNAAVRFHFRQAGSNVMALEYLDSTGNFVQQSTYTIRDGGGAVGDAYHHLMMALNYKQGNGGYCNYALIKIDDDTEKPTGPPNAQSIATGGVRESVWDVIIEDDNGVATVVNIGEVDAGDLSNTFQL